MLGIEARDIRFYPSAIDVPAGDRLVIDVNNTDAEDVHDLVLDDGLDTGRLSPGDSARLEVGVVGRDIAGWCSVVGHRQMGMVLRVTATGAPASPGDPSAAHRSNSAACIGAPSTPPALASIGPDGLLSRTRPASPGAVVLGELLIPSGVPVWTYCRSGFRSYLTPRLLAQSGWPDAATRSGAVS